MNYWLLTTEYPPLFGGGISTYCFHTARMLADRGIQVTVFLPDIRESAYTIQVEKDIRLIRFNPHRSGVGAFLGSSPRMSYEFAMIVRDIIRLEGKPDIIESQDYLAIAYYLLQFKALKYPEFEGIPVLLTLHAPAFLYLEYNREETFRYPNYWTGELEWASIASADHIISPSVYLVNEIRRFGSVPEKRLSVIRNPYAAQADLASAPPFTPGEIVFYGKLSPQKGVFELMEYMDRLWEKDFPHSLTLIGGTDKVYYPDMKTMGQVIGDKYADYIRKGLLRVLGQISPSERDERLSSAQVILIPSRGDNLPYAAIEAMAIGKVVLASVQGGQGEIMPSGTGFLFDHRQPDSFGEQLQHILSLSEAELRAVGERAAAYIRKELDYENIYTQKIQVIDQLIAGKGLAPGTFPFIREIAPPAATTLSGEPGLLTVVIPYYNMGVYINECVASVRASTYQPLEILVVNDGSTETGVETILAAVAAQPNVRVIHRTNHGLCDTRNVGAAGARGEYLAFLDADDCVLPEYYSKSIRVLKAYGNVSFVGCWVQYFEGNDQVWPTWNPEAPYILLHNSVNSSALVYKRAAFLESGLNDRILEYGLEDYESVIGLLAGGHRGVVLPELLFRYRVRKGSMFRSLTIHKVLYSYQYIAEKYQALYSRYTVPLYNLLNANGPSHAYDNPSLEVRVTTKVARARDPKARLKEFAKRNPALKAVILRLRDVLKIR